MKPLRPLASLSQFLQQRHSGANDSITATSGSIYGDIGQIASTRFSAPSGGIGLNVFGGVALSSLNSNASSTLYARSGIISTTVESQVGAARVFTSHMFSGTVKTHGAGNAEVQAWDGVEGEITAEKATANVLSYGEMKANVTAGRNIGAAVWGTISGNLSADESIRAFARKDLTGTVTAGKGSVKIVSGGNVTGEVKTSLEAPSPDWTVSITTFGEVSGKVSGGGSVEIAADTISSPEVLSKLGGVTLTAIHEVNSKVKGQLDITVNAGFKISSPGGGGQTNATSDQMEEGAGIRSFGGSVRLGTAGAITQAGVAAFEGVTATARTEISGLKGVAGESFNLVSLGTVGDTVAIAKTGEVTAFAGDAASMNLTANSGDVTVTALGDLSGSFAGLNEVYVISFGSLSGASASGDKVVAFGFQNAAVTLTGTTLAVAESMYSVSGSVDAGSSQVFAGLDSSANLTSRRFSYVTAGTDVSGTVTSDGKAVAISQGRGKMSGSVTAAVTGDQSAKAVAIGGSVTATVKSDNGDALAFAGENISGTVDGGINAGAFAVGNISGGEIKAKGSAKAIALGTIGSKLNAESGFALAVAGKDVTGEIQASKNAVAGSVSGVVSSTVKTTNGSALVVAMDGITGSVTAHRHAIALSYGSISGAVTANNGTAVVASVGGSVSGDVTAGGNALVVGFDFVSGEIEADKSILAASLGSVSGMIDAEEYATVLAAGDVSGSSVTAGKSALVVALGNVTAPVTAEDGSLLIITLGNVKSTLSATEFVVVIAGGDVDISVPASQDLIVISGGETEYRFQSSQQESAAAAAYSGTQGPLPAAAASRDLVLFGLGGVKGNVRSGRDAVLVNMGGGSSSVSAGRDAILYSFDGIHRTSQNQIPSIAAGGDAILISGSSTAAHLVGGKNAMLLSLGSASNSTVSGDEFAAAIALGSGLNLDVDGDEGAFAWTYGDYSGSITSSEGSAVLASIGNALDSTVHGKGDSVAVTVGAFSGSVTSDDEYAGIISLLNASGTLNAGKGAVVITDGSSTVDTTAEEDLLVWTRGDVRGTYSAGRDALVVSHGTFDASLNADRDIVFAYAGTSLKGSLTAGRWIGDGSTSAPGDPTEIDDVFSHGDIMAQILAGTLASTDPDKGRIGTIGSIGTAGGTYAAGTINRVRSGGLVTASINTGAAAFTGNNGGNGTGTVIVLQNQTNLINDVPKPVLEPSQQGEILADAAATKAEVLADRAEAVQAIEDAKTSINDEREAALEEKEAVRTEISEEVDLVMRLADAAVAAATVVVKASLAQTRKASDELLKQTEAGYLNLEAEIRSIRDKLDQALLMSQTTAVASMELAKWLLTTFGDPAILKKQQKIQADAAQEIQIFKSNYDVNRALAAKAIYGAAWQDYIDETYFDSVWKAFFTGAGDGAATGLRATGNAAIDTAWGLVTLGFGEPWNVFDTSGEGYATSYLFARGGFELLTGLGLGAAAKGPGTIGKVAFAVDMSGNGASVLRGGYGAWKDGEMNFQDGVQIIAGGIGLGGGWLGRMSNAADGAKPIDDIAKAADDIVAPNCFVADTLVLMQQLPLEPTEQGLFRSPLPLNSTGNKSNADLYLAAACFVIGIGLKGRRLRLARKRRVLPELKSA